MSYQVTYTETNNPLKPPITVEDGTLNKEVSVQFVGQGYTGFAPIIANDLLHLLENFASPTEPTNPVQGQLWYDTQNAVLKVWDGGWSPAGALRKAIAPPTNGVVGDLWVNTTTSQLFVYSGSNWLLVGPQFSIGTQTGPIVESIVDVDNVTHSVLTFFANNSRLAILSKEAFVPKALIAGFSNIYQGFNLNTIDQANATTPIKYWGTAGSASALYIDSKEVPATNFLRSDVASVTNSTLSVRSDAGLSIGSTLGFNIGVNGNTTVLSSNSSGNGISFKLNNGGTLSTLLHLTADAKVGIGTNNTNPASTLDVAGVITTSGGLNVVATSSGSITTAGGANIAGNVSVGGTLSTYKKVYLNNLNANTGIPEGGSVLMPGPVNNVANAAANLYDIGSDTVPFRNIYAQNFVGAFSGTFSGSLTGRVFGSADKLASETTFYLDGDVTSNYITFDGQGDNPAVFNTQINAGFITSKDVATDSIASDQILVYRSNPSGLLRMSKDVFLNHVATVPAGAIFPFAGTVVPNGYLLCDGAEVEIAKYPVLYRAIGNTYKSVSLLRGQNTFGLPDLRGRFPLGRDNMNNGISVPSKDGSGTTITTIEPFANRVTDITADTLGTGSGSEKVSLNVSNIPDHKHNLNSGTTQYYAGSISGSTPDPAAIPGLGLPATSTGSGLPNSGGVISSNPLGSAFNVMNPYATINFIIFTGVIS